MTTNIASSRELILAALTRATNPLTVTELAEEAGVGKSTASKYLPVLEKEGQAVRTPGGREGRRRLPDHWKATPTTSAGTPPTADPTPSRIAENPDKAEEATSASATSTHEQAALAPIETATATQEPSVEDPALGSENPNAVTPVSAGVSEAGGVPASPRLSTDTGAGEEEVNPVSGTRRLKPGELKLMVWALLKNSPQEEFTATKLSHLLQGRSIGAIQNNLARLSRENKAEVTCEKPLRYRYAIPTT
ncbi:helix-turn-helix domain-containing protein [Nocardiopsis alba]|uniref:helix-turn-helix domain-containing protein n=1 Tax=Nocardiopsis alba TaxID=53437 RepID=UPI0033D294CE